MRKFNPLFGGSSAGGLLSKRIKEKKAKTSKKNFKEPKKNKAKQRKAIIKQITTR